MGCLCSILRTACKHGLHGSKGHYPRRRNRPVRKATSRQQVGQVLQVMQQAHGEATRATVTHAGRQTGQTRGSLEVRLPCWHPCHRRPAPGAAPLSAAKGVLEGRAAAEVFASGMNAGATATASASAHYHY